MDTFRFIEENGQFKVSDSKHESFVDCSATIVPVIELLEHWEDLVNELSEKEIALFKWKHCYQVKSDEIIAHTDFKELYGANNQKVRDNHVRNELNEWYDIIKDLEFSIDYLTRRISFIRELVHIKGVMVEAKK